MAQCFLKKYQNTSINLIVFKWIFFFFLLSILSPSNVPIFVSLKSMLASLLLGLLPVWPDLAILKEYWRPILLQKKPNNIIIFWCQFLVTTVCATFAKNYAIFSNIWSH